MLGAAIWLLVFCCLCRSGDLLTLLLGAHPLAQAMLICITPSAGWRLVRGLLAGVGGDAGVGVKDGQVGALALLPASTLWCSLALRLVQVQWWSADTRLMQQEQVCGGLKVSTA